MPLNSKRYEGTQVKGMEGAGDLCVDTHAISAVASSAAAKDSTLWYSDVV